MKMRKYVSAFIVACAMMLVPMNAGAANTLLGNGAISLDGKWKIFSLKNDVTYRHKVSVGEAGRLSIDFETSCGMNRVNLVDADGVELYRKELKGSVSLTDTADIDFDLLPGNYFLQYEYVNEPGAYRMKAEFTPAGNNEKEPNDIHNKAMKLDLEKSVTGFLTKSLGLDPTKKSAKVDTADYYSFVVEKDQKMKITYTPDQKNGSFELVNANMITQRRQKAVSTVPYVCEMPLKAGTYYISISNNNDSKLEETGSGKYTLLVEPSEKPVVKGSVFTDSVSGMKYTVSSVSKNTGTAILSELTDKEAVSASVPEAIKIGEVTLKVTTVAEDAFANCSKLQTVSIGKNVTKIGNRAFKDCTSLTTVSGAQSVENIGIKTFYKCSALKQIGGKKNRITLSKVKLLGKQAFFGCTSVNRVYIPSPNLQRINAGAFSGCSNLKLVSIASGNMTTIGKNTFNSCEKLKQVTMKTTKLSVVGKNAFKGVVENCAVKVPKAKVKAYKKLLTKEKMGTLLSVKKM